MVLEVSKVGDSVTSHFADTPVKQVTIKAPPQTKVTHAIECPLCITGRQ